MAYQPTVWQAGDTITSARLNKLEQGVAGGGAGGMVVHTTVDMETHAITVTDATAGEIWDAMSAGSSVTVLIEIGGVVSVRSRLIDAEHHESNGYAFLAITTDANMKFVASTAADHPVLNDN